MPLGQDGVLDPQHALWSFGGHCIEVSKASQGVLPLVQIVITKPPAWDGCVLFWHVPAPQVSRLCFTFKVMRDAFGNREQSARSDDCDWKAFGRDDQCAGLCQFATYRGSTGGIQVVRVHFQQAQITQPRDLPIHCWCTTIDRGRAWQLHLCGSGDNQRNSHTSSICERKQSLGDLRRSYSARRKEARTETRAPQAMRNMFECLIEARMEIPRSRDGTSSYCQLWRIATSRTPRGLSAAEPNASNACVLGSQLLLQDLLGTPRSMSRSADSP